jgi:hypothetical protein
MARITEHDTRLQEEAITSYSEQRQAEFGEGLGLDFVRVRELKGLAEKIGTRLATLLAEGGRVDEIAKLAGVYRATLADISAETGGRMNPTRVKKELTDFALELARSQGYEDSVAVKIAKMIAEDGR